MKKAPSKKQKIHQEEKWLFDPKNKAIVEELKEALKQKATKKIDLESFEIITI